MRAIYKKEMLSFRTTVMGYVFVAFLLAATGLYYSFTCLNLASPKFEAVFSNVRFVFLVFVPIMTMRSVAEERKQKTDQLLFTLPLAPWKIAAGKYLALVSVYAVPMLIVCTYPLILSRYGTVRFQAAYGSILGFFLLGCASLAIGMLSSCMTESPVTAALLSFFLLFLSYVMNTISRMVPGTASGSLAGFILLLLLASFLIYRILKSLMTAGFVFLAGFAVLTFLFFHDRTVFEGSLSSFLNLFWLNGRLDGFSDGILDLRAVIYYLSFSFAAVFLAAHVLSGHGTREDSHFQDGCYRLISLALCLAALSLLNRIADKLPSALMEPDFSVSGVYTLTKETRLLLEELDEEIHLYLICEKGKEDASLERLLTRYQEECPMIAYEKKDPVLYPGFVSGFTDKKLNDNSVIAVGNNRSQIIAYQDMYTIGTSAVTGRRIETGFSGENLITGAIASLLKEETAVFYLPDANGEQMPGNSFSESLQNTGIEIRPLNLISSDAIPDDAAGLIINAPTSDYSRESTEKILSYLEAGGKALILSNYSLEEMPEFDSILADYGMERLDGILLEGDSSRYMSYQYCLIPSVSYTKITADVYRDCYLLLPMAQGIKEKASYRGSVSLTPLLSTSSYSYNKEDVQNMTTAEPEAGDETGPFLVGLLAQEDIDQDGVPDTEVVYYSSGYLLDEDYNHSVSGTNAVLFAGTLRYLAGDSSSFLQIPVKSLQEPVLAITDHAADFWTVVCVFILPGLSVLAGTVTWLVRKNRKA